MVGAVSTFYRFGPPYSSPNHVDPNLPRKGANPFGQRRPEKSSEHARFGVRTVPTAVGFPADPRRESPAKATAGRCLTEANSGAGLHQADPGQVHHSSIVAMSSSDQPKWWASSCTMTFVTNSNRVTFPLSTHSSTIARRNSQIASGRSG